MLLVGAAWVLLTISFEIVLGRMLMGLSWARIWSDYDVTRGGLMPLGLLVMLAAPFAGTWLYRSVRVRRRRRAWTRRTSDTSGSAPARSA